MTDKFTNPIRYTLVENNTAKAVDAEIIVETPVSLTVNGEAWLTFMCTPTYLEAMAVGFLFNEGLIDSVEDIASTRICDHGENVDIWLYKSVEKPKNWRRTSGCTGGMTSIVEELTPPLSIAQSKLNGSILTANQVYYLIGELFQSQELYRKSGGVHTSALSDGKAIIVIAEDIGRHNTLDKLSGRCILEGFEFSPRIILTTGRISSEMMQKAIRIGASSVISRTSPSSLSVEMAGKWGITLIGYARRNSFNLYSHPQRILIDKNPTNPEGKVQIHTKRAST